MNDIRQNIYRAKRKDNGQWTIGYLVVYPSGAAKIYERCLEPPDVLAIRDVDPETVCKGVTLEDKTGILELFEGDVFDSDDGTGVERYIIDFDKDSLKWAATALFESVEYPLGEFFVQDIDVIGNKFDNPELFYTVRKTSDGFLIGNIPL